MVTLNTDRPEDNWNIFNLLYLIKKFYFKNFYFTKNVRLDY